MPGFLLLCLCTPLPHELRLSYLKNRAQDLEAWACACPSWVSTNSHPVMCRSCTIGMMIHIPPLNVPQDFSHRTQSSNRPELGQARCTHHFRSHHRQRTQPVFRKINVPAHQRQRPRQLFQTFWVQSFQYICCDLIR